MEQKKTTANLTPLISQVGSLWSDPQDQLRITEMIHVLDTRYELGRKIAGEPGVEEILLQMVGRLARSFTSCKAIEKKKILDIACGSNSSKAPPSLLIKTPFGKIPVKRTRQGYTALFEPWFCRILLELGADAVGIDFGDLEQETFAHFRVDLGKPGALGFLPDRSFDAIQDSRLFGSPEFTAQFPHPEDRLEIAREIVRQESRLLKPGGILVHSDAAAMLR